MIGVERFAEPFASRSQQNLAPLVYRVGTLAESGRRSAVQPTAAQRLPAPMLAPFSLGGARKGSAEPASENKKTAPWRGF